MIRVKKLNPSSYFTEDEIRAAYKVYRDAELSTFDLGRLLYKKHGYSSPEVCATALYRAFKLRGWELRSRSESRKIALRRRGFAVGPEARAEKRYERYEREMGRPHQPPCAATTLRGTKCQHPAKVGSTLCAFHRGPDPDRQCHGINTGQNARKGLRCRRLCRPGSDYCAKHAHLELAEAA